MRGLPIIISGPSGAGKTTLYQRAIKELNNLCHSVSYTTRPARAGETDGVDYHFVDADTFDSMAEANEFLEHFTVHGNKYGTARVELYSLLNAGTDVILEIDVQGAAEVRRSLPETEGVFIFILPPSLEVCKERLCKRGKDKDEEIERRLKIALEEIRHASEYDYIIINDSLEHSFKTLTAIILAEKVKEPRLKETVSRLFD